VQALTPRGRVGSLVANQGVRAKGAGRAFWETGHQRDLAPFRQTMRGPLPVRVDGLVALNTIAALLRGLAAVNGMTLLACRHATMALVGGIAVVIAASVFWRYALNDALSWSEEVGKYMMIWLVFTGAPIALRRGGHVAIEILPNALPERLKQLLFAVVFLIIALLMAMLVYRGITFAWNGRTQMAITVGNISMAWIFAAVPIGSAIMLLVALEASLLRLGHAIDPERFPLPPPYDYADMVSE
jgi:TRAP-type C4-dicarboxylate transport system permease small subunit